MQIWYDEALDITVWPTWPHEQPFLLPYFHLYWRSNWSLMFGIINQTPFIRAGEAYDMWGLTVGYDIQSDCRGAWLYWGQRRLRLFSRARQDMVDRGRTSW